jgi:hypothetical protein
LNNFSQLNEGKPMKKSAEPDFFQRLAPSELKATLVDMQAFSKALDAAAGALARAETTLAQATLDVRIAETKVVSMRRAWREAVAEIKAEAVKKQKRKKK